MIQEQLSLKTFFLIFIYLIISTLNGLLAADSDSILVIFEGSSGEDVSSAEAGMGLSYNEDTLNINVDNSTLEIDSDILRIKAGGITGNEIANSAIDSAHISDGAITGTHLSADSSTAAFIYNLLPDIPTVLSITPSEVIEGYSSFTATITGTNFESYAQGRIGDTELTDENVTSSTTMTVTVPSDLAIGTYDISVRNWWESGTASNIFEVKSPFPMDNILAYYRFNETSGNLLDEVSGNNITSNNNVSLGATGLIDNCLYFNRSLTAYLQTPYYSIDRTNYTICFWTKENRVDNSNWLMGRISPDAHMYIVYNPDNSIHFASGGGLDDDTSPVTRDNNWHHLCAVGGSTQKWFYYDGVRIMESNQSTTGLGNYNYYIGRYGAYTSNSYDGYMDELGIWNRILTTEEIQSLYNSGNGVTYP